MGEEVKMSEFESNGLFHGISEWETGLPSLDDLPPLSHSLLPPELASAFSISPVTCRTITDVNRESHNTLSSLSSGGIAAKLKVLASTHFLPCIDDEQAAEPMAVEVEDETEAEPAEAEVETEEINTDRDVSPSEPKKLRRINSEEADSALRLENSGEDPAAKTPKRPRLVWTPQLHKRFVDVVGYLGIKNAVPKTIMQLMNVDGLTRENVASHLQKYRLYLKRMQGSSSNEEPSPADQLFASTPVPENLHESGSGAAPAGGANGGGSAATPGNVNTGGHLAIPIPVPYHPTAGQMLPMPMYGHMGMQFPGNHHHHPHPHHQQITHYNHPFNVLQQNNYGPVITYPPHPHNAVPPTDNM